METFLGAATTRRERRIDLCLLLLLVGAFWIASAYSLRLGVLNNEGYWYLPYYLSDRPLLAKVFDSRNTEAGLYQARELSYLFDWFDSVVIAACVHVGVPHFLSVTYFVFTLLLVFSLWHLCRQQLRLDREVSWLLVAMYLSGPHALLSGSYSRTAKIGVALALVRAVLGVHRALRRPRAPASGHLLLECLTLAVWCGVACGFDRQGVFLTGCLAIILTVWSIGHRDTRAVVLLGAPAGALLAAALYNRTVAPTLTWSLNGYWPDFSYQQLPLNDLYADPLHYLREGGLLVLDTLRFTYGHLTPPQAVIMTLGVGYTFWAVGRTTAQSLTGMGIFCAMVGLLVGMHALMVLRHPDVVQPDLRRCYYGLVTGVLAVIALAYSIRAATVRWQPRRQCLRLGLAIVVMCNIAAMPQHLAYVHQGWARWNIMHSPRLIAGLRALAQGDEVTDPVVESDEIYQFFRERRVGRAVPCRRSTNPLKGPWDRRPASQQSSPRGRGKYVRVHGQSAPFVYHHDSIASPDGESITRERITERGEAAD